MPHTTDRRVIIVTGASAGIGRELVRAALREKWAVLAVARREDRLRALADEAAQGRDRIATLVADVCAPGAPSRIAGEALSRFNRIDVVVNNAGVAAPGPLLEQSDAALDRQWQLHVAAPVRITREALPALRRSQGQVIFIGSGVARVPVPDFGAYSAAKAAIRAAAIQLRRELRGSGVVVTYVDPGSVNTEFSEASGMRRSSPQWLLAKPERVAKRIMRAIHTRKHTMNAVPLHTFGTSIGEHYPWLADRLVRYVVDRPRVSSTPSSPLVSQAATQPTVESAAAPQPQSDFTRALAPVARRLERVNLSQDFLTSVLRAGGEVTLSDAAMRWAGMPNKNERAAMKEALDALETGGFLRSTGDESWDVLKGP